MRAPAGSAGIRYPGERAASQRTADGIPVAPKVWAGLQAAAEKLDVPLPSVVA